MKHNIKCLLFFFAVILAIWLLSSCTPQQRLNRLHAKHPELFQKDTIRVIDSFYLPTAKADTVFRQSTIKDTVVVNNDRLQMKYYYNNDTVFLSGTCRDTTIIKEVRVVTDKAIISQEKDLPRWVWWALGGAFILGMLVLRFLRS